MKKLPDVSEAELELLQALWEEGPGTVREVASRLKGKRWAYTTTQTLLNRLELKGYAAVDKTNLAHIYRATVGRQNFLSQRLHELSETICGGETSPLVAALVSARKIKPEEIEQFRKLIDEYDKNRK